MKISARNQLKGKVKSVKHGPVSTEVVISVANGASEYTGVPIAKLVESAGIALGKSVRGERLAEFVMIRATDGYRVLFSISEIDPMFRERTLLLCYRKNGAPLPGTEGPLRVVVADEKRHARWVRQVIAIELGRVEAPASR
jgi:molybdopterin-binding protein